MPTQLGRKDRRDIARESGSEVRPRDALRDGALEESAGSRHREERGDRAGTRALPEDGDPAGIASKGCDVLVHPLQGRDLVEQPAIDGVPAEQPEPSNPTR